MHDNPWKTLPPGQAGTLAVLRIPGLTSLEAFWARKPDGRLALLVALHQIEDAPLEVPLLRGVDVLVLPAERQLQFVLEATGDWEMFRALCMDLLAASNDASEQAGALQLLIHRLILWQRLLSKGGGKLLDEREVRGLMGELLFLRDRLLPHAGANSVGCWQGPEGLPQDFVHAGRLIEVKTYAAGSNPSVRISSAEQLSSGDVPLFLHVICLVRQEGALCLPVLVDEIRSLLRAAPLQADAFDEKLLGMGYVDLPDYRSMAFAVTSASDYQVRDGFPRLSVQHLPVGVTDVSYSIQLTNLRPFSVPAGAVIDPLGGDT